MQSSGVRKSFKCLLWLDWIQCQLLQPLLRKGASSLAAHREAAKLWGLRAPTWAGNGQFSDQSICSFIAFNESLLFLNSVDFSTSSWSYTPTFIQKHCERNVTVQISPILFFSCVYQPVFKMIGSFKLSAVASWRKYPNICKWCPGWIL